MKRVIVNNWFVMFLWTFLWLHVLMSWFVLVFNVYLDQAFDGLIVVMSSAVWVNGVIRRLNNRNRCNSSYVHADAVLIEKWGKKYLLHHDKSTAAAQNCNGCGEKQWSKRSPGGIRFIRSIVVTVRTHWIAGHGLHFAAFKNFQKICFSVVKQILDCIFLQTCTGKMSKIRASPFQTLVFDCID